jgi:hypothetical protein
MRLRKSRGQASAEFVLIAGALAVALFYPFAQQGPVFILLTRALMNYFKAQSFVISIL